MLQWTEPHQPGHDFLYSGKELNPYYLSGMFTPSSMKGNLNNEFSIIGLALSSEALFKLRSFLFIAYKVEDICEPNWCVHRANVMLKSTFSSYKVIGKHISKNGLSILTWRGFYLLLLLSLGG